MDLIFGVIWKVAFSLIFLGMEVLCAIILWVQAEMMVEKWREKDWHGFSDKLLMVTILLSMMIGIAIVVLRFI
jgi:uncharacterized membrane protein